MPVNAIATSTGKYTNITGVNKVPKPKPEKKVSTAAKKLTKDIMMISIKAQLGTKLIDSFTLSTSGLI